MNATLTYEGRNVVFCDTNPKDHIEGLFLLQGKWYELGNLEFIKSLKITGNYVDVGAYVGTYSLFFSLFCPASTVYSFEPQPDIYQKLRQNLEINGITNCVPYNVALSNHTGKGKPGRWGEDEKNRGGTAFLEGEGEVEAITLDSLNLNVSVMKIDVEGKELSVLEGARNTLLNVQHLFIELWNEGQCKAIGNVEYTFDKVTNLLVLLGFYKKPVLLSDCVYWFKRE